MTGEINSTGPSSRVRPTWRAWVVLIFFGALLFLALARYGKLVLWRPIMFSAAAIAVAAWARWELHNRVWFWLVVAAFIALHTLAITLVPWNSRWVPAAVILPIVIVDCLLILVSLQLVEKLVTGK